MVKYFENTDIKIVESSQERERLRYAYFLNEVAEQHKSEFINGEIVLHSPARKKHIDIGLNLVHIMRDYVDKKRLGYVGQEKVL